MPGERSGKAPLRGAFLFACLLYLAPPLLALGTVNAAPATARVARVIDGDTVVLPGGRLLRLIGINSPELGKDGRPDEPLAAAARARLADLVQSAPATITPGREPTDRHGRLLAYLTLPSGEDAQERLLREGLAAVVAIPPNLERLERYQTAERAARQAGRGLWSHPYFAPAPASRARALPTGFRFLHGRVERVFVTETFIYLTLAERFAVRVPREDWRYFAETPWDLKGAQIEVRGWMSERDGRRRMTVRHPAMIRVLN